MLHHPSGTARGQASDIHNEARELMRLRNYVNKVLCQATGQPIEKVGLFPLIPATIALPCVSPLPSTRPSCTQLFPCSGRLVRYL